MATEEDMMPKPTIDLSLLTEDDRIALAVRLMDVIVQDGTQFQFVQTLNRENTIAFDELKAQFEDF